MLTDIQNFPSSDIVKIIGDMQLCPATNQLHDCNLYLRSFVYLHRLKSVHTSVKSDILTEKPLTERDNILTGSPIGLQTLVSLFDFHGHGDCGGDFESSLNLLGLLSDWCAALDEVNEVIATRLNNSSEKLSESRSARGATITRTRHVLVCSSMGGLVAYWISLHK